jgi:hypothetical protein
LGKGQDPDVSAGTGGTRSQFESTSLTMGPKVINSCAGDMYNADDVVNANSSPNVEADVRSDRNDRN